jgi:uncharacterized DUF497 family protein
MQFEWDESKRLSNIAKHRLDFTDAIRVFRDDKAYVYAARDEFDEKRFVIVGALEGIVIAVVYTRRDANTRIISARRARREERRRYDG